MFFKKARKIKELEELIEIRDSRILEQGDLLRVTLERERKLTRIKNKQDVLIRNQKKINFEI